MSIIYIIFFLFPRPTLITIYIDLRLAWHWFSSEDSKKNSGNLRRRDFLQFCSFFLTLASSSNINFHQEIFSVRMLFIFLTVTLLCFDIILMFFFLVVFVVVRDRRWHIYLPQVSAAHIVPLSVYWNQIKSKNPKVKKIQQNDEKKKPATHTFCI